MVEVFECKSTQKNKSVHYIVTPPSVIHHHILTHLSLSLSLSLSFPSHFRYKLALLKPSSKALSPSSKIALRMDTRGFLSLQFMIVTEDKQLCFVEYLVSEGL